MVIEVHVITNAKKRELRQEGSHIKVKIVSLPQEGKANAELIEFLSRFLGVRKSEIVILKGEREKRKLISLPLDEGEFARAMGKAMGR